MNSVHERIEKLTAATFSCTGGTGLEVGIAAFDGPSLVATSEAAAATAAAGADILPFVPPPLTVFPRMVLSFSVVIAEDWTLADEVPLPPASSAVLPLLDTFFDF